MPRYVIVSTKASTQGDVLRQYPGMPEALADSYAELISKLAVNARHVVRDLDPQVCTVLFFGCPLTPSSKNDLVFFRVRAQKHEIMVAPGTQYPQCVSLLPYVLFSQRFYSDRYPALAVGAPSWKLETVPPNNCKEAVVSTNSRRLSEKVFLY
jgi:hypothetical protein